MSAPAKDETLPARPLTLAINGKFKSARMTGVERYAENVLQHLVPMAIRRGHKVIFIGSADPGIPSFSEQSIVKSRIPKSVLGRHVWEQLVLPVFALMHEADYLLNLTNTSPVLFANNVVTLHDVSWLEKPEWFSRSFRAFYSLITPLAVKRARSVITVSNYSREQIVRHLGNPHKVAVVLEGVGPEFRQSSQADVLNVLRQFDLRRGYILHVGTLQPRKNLSKLITAFKRICESSIDPPYLVLAGGRSAHFADDSLEEEIKSCAYIKQLGYVEDEQLPALYSGALFTVSASVYEGFGLTLLEAMACGCPVTASSIPPYREVADESVLFFDPFNVDSVYSALERLVTDARLREDLQRRGFERAKLFRWETHAKQLLSTIESM
jgi:glycosyltransferase involved in cell wall biosynthesis